MLRYFSISELCVLLVTELLTGDTLGLRFLLKHTDASFGVRKKSTPHSDSPNCPREPTEKGSLIIAHMMAFVNLERPTLSLDVSPC